jgi:hypothetical protein
LASVTGVVLRRFRRLRWPAIVEGPKFVHEIVKAPAGSREFAQRKTGQRAGGRGPQEQREMREIAALRENID